MKTRVISIILIVLLTLSAIVGCGKTAKSTDPPTDPPVTATIGSPIEFGGITWRVLDVQNGKMLIISEEVLLFLRAYNDEMKEVTWETCDLRKYLNGDFYNATFSASEKARIAETRVVNKDNQWYGTAGGKDTTDKIFLLSLEEVCRYFGDSSGNLANRGNNEDDWYISDENDGRRIAKNYGSDAASWWWLRSPGYISNTAALVNGDGAVLVYGDVYRVGGVRPALWLNP